MLIYFLIFIGALLLLAIVFIIFFNLTKICDGGDLFTGCGKILFPWTKKFKLPSGKYCCLDCYSRDVKLFAEFRKDQTGPLLFTEKEEEFYSDDEK